MEVSLPQIINTNKHTKTACSNRVSVQYFSRKILQNFSLTLKDFYINFLQFEGFGNQGIL